MATAEDLQKQLDAQQAQLNSMQDILQRAFNISEDALKTLINAKSVGVNGKLGGLSAADTLADAPVGDAAKLISNIGAVAQSDIEALAKKDSLTAADVGAMASSETLNTIPIGGDVALVRGRLGLGAGAVSSVFPDYYGPDLPIDTGVLVTAKQLLETLARAREGIESKQERNGYIKIGAGIGCPPLVIQWGEVNDNGWGSDAAFQFSPPIAFPNIGLVAFVCQKGITSGASNAQEIAILSNNTIAVRRTTVGTPKHSFYWVAIGC